MLTVTRRGDYDLTLCGHAGAGEKGQDLVCAGASILALTLEAALLDLAGQDAAELLALALKPGRAHFSAAPKGEKEETLKALFDTVATGYALLARNAPRHLTFTREE